ncbi:MAG: DNA-3-methyladenine glycosylase [Roseiflexaceae bacterium]
MHHTTINLAATAPFVFDQTLDFLADFGPLRDDQVIANGTLSRAMLIEQQLVVTHIRAAGDGVDGVAVHIQSEQPCTAAVVAQIGQRIDWTLGLSDDLTPFYAIANDDPIMRPIVEQLYGYHHALFPSPFEIAVWAVLSQRNTLTSARHMRSALVERYGQALLVEGRRWRAFPNASDLAADDPGQITATIGHSQKGPAVAAVAAAFAGIGADWPNWLRETSYDQAERWLLDIHGIGPWGASFILLRGVGRMERLPRGERKLLAAIGQAYRQSGPVSERDAARLAARYGAYCGYWAHYLRVAI